MSVQQRTLDCKDLHSYLKTLPSGVLDRLYNHPAICLAVFRELPELSRHFIMRVLFVDHAVPDPIIRSWVSPTNSDELDDAFKLLADLRVWHAVDMQNAFKRWLLNPMFRRNLKGALLGGGSKRNMKLPSEPDPKAPNVTYLDQYAMERWEGVLNCMIGSNQHDVICSDALQLLHHAGLMKKEQGETTMSITHDGFQFLLMNTSAQVWYFLLQYLDTAGARNLDLVECLGFLFQLSFSTSGQDYSTDSMSESLLRLLQHLREFGLVFQRKRKAGRFYPTKLALDIASGRNKSALNSITTNSLRNGYIVVETNFRVYAYTDSSLRVALIALFCELMYRFPHLVVGIITRRSIRRALRSGITAEQIISFLRQYAHSECYKDPPVLPSTIADQIKLWSDE